MRNSEFVIEWSATQFLNFSFLGSPERGAGLPKARLRGLLQFCKKLTEGDGQTRMSVPTRCI